MGRLIDPVPRGGRLFAGESNREKTQEAAERIARYVPAEVIAAYLALLPIVVSGTDPDTDRRTILLGLIFAMGIIFTALYIWRVPGDSKVKPFHLVLSTLAFGLWSYSIRGGFLEDIGLYDSVVAPILLVSFSLASGFAAPTED